MICEHCLFSLPGIIENEQADQLSLAAAQGDDLVVDETYEADDSVDSANSSL